MYMIYDLCDFCRLVMLARWFTKQYRERPDLVKVGGGVFTHKTHQPHSTKPNTPFCTPPTTQQRPNNPRWCSPCPNMTPFRGPPTTWWIGVPLVHAWPFLLLCWCVGWPSHNFHPTVPSYPEKEWHSTRTLVPPKSLSNWISPCTPSNAPTST
jgi:hypothetical protein